MQFWPQVWSALRNLEPHLDSGGGEDGFALCADDECDALPTVVPTDIHDKFADLRVGWNRAHDVWELLLVCKKQNVNGRQIELRLHDKFLHSGFFWCFEECRGQISSSS